MANMIISFEASSESIESCSNDKRMTLRARVAALTSLMVKWYRLFSSTSHALSYSEIPSRVANRFRASPMPPKRNEHSFGDAIANARSNSEVAVS